MTPEFVRPHLARLIKSSVSWLPVRRSLATNLLLDFFKISRPFQGRFMNLKVEVHPNEPASRAAYFLGFYERETTMWALDFIQRTQPQTIIDIGANFGYFTLLSLNQSPRSSVHAFEPDPHNREWLRRNVEMNQLQGQVHITPAAVSSGPGEVSFVPSEPEAERTLWSQIDMGGTTTGKTITVPAMSLDQYVQDKKLKSVDLVKMDIEGAEGFAVEGMKQGIKNFTYKNVLIEMHGDRIPAPHTVQSIVEAFISAGYACYRFVPTYKNTDIDRLAETYDLRWKPEILQPYTTTGVMTEWEHFLFAAPSRDQ